MIYAWNGKNYPYIFDDLPFIGLNILHVYIQVQLFLVTPHSQIDGGRKSSWPCMVFAFQFSLHIFSLSSENYY